MKFLKQTLTFIVAFAVSFYTMDSFELTTFTRIALFFGIYLVSALVFEIIFEHLLKNLIENRPAKKKTNLK